MKTKFSKKQAIYWDSYTKSIEKLDLINIPKAEKLEFAFFKKLIGPLKDKSILDLGCGTGKLGLKLAMGAKEVIGIDISSHSIEVANRTAKEYKLKNFKGKVGDFKNQGYNKRFDVILAVNLIHHADDLETIFSHVRLALKKNGRLIIFEMNPLNLLFVPFLIMIGQIKSHLTLQYLRSNPVTLRAVIVNNGFEIDKSLRWGWLPTALYNKSMMFMRLNNALNKIPLVNYFTAFNILICKDSNPGND